MKNRKIFVFVVCLIVAMISSRYMTIEFYEKFLDFLLYVVLGFFAGNFGEHASNALSKKPIQVIEPKPYPDETK